MRTALVNISTGVVENIIVADPAIDPAPSGYVLISVGEKSCKIDWVYDASLNEFADPAEVL
jgi:hypothetical protein